jgi:hypothetical protein
MTYSSSKAFVDPGSATPNLSSPAVTVSQKTRIAVRITKRIHVIPSAWAVDHAAAGRRPVILVDREWDGIPIDTEVRAIVLKDGMGAPLAWESHKRGSNWAAVLKGKNAAHLERDHRPYSQKRLDYGKLKVGEVLEIGADYTTGRGQRCGNRVYAVAAEVKKSRFAFVEYPTAAQAMKAANIVAENIRRILSENLAAANAKRSATMKARFSARAEQSAAGCCAETPISATETSIV